MSFLLLAIFSCALISPVMRWGTSRVKNNISMLAVSYLSCCLLALLHSVAGHAAFSGEGMGAAVLMGTIAGVLLLAGFLCLQVNVQTNGIVLSGIFGKLGVLVPTLISVIFFGERFRVLQLIGFILAIAAILLIHWDKNNTQAGSKAALILLLLTSGFADAMSKIYEELGRAELQEMYLLLSFLVAFVLCALLALYKKQRLSLPDVGWGLLLGIPNYYSFRFLIKSLGRLPAVVVYPSYSVGSIVVITLLGVLFFREKINARQKLAILVILAALVLLNL